MGANTTQINLVLSGSITDPARPVPAFFDGKTYEERHDGERLASQFERVFSLMKDGRWRTLEEIAATVHGSESGVSARLRDMRKPKFGGHTVERRARGDRERGLFEYRLIVNKTTAA